MFDKLKKLDALQQKSSFPLNHSDEEHVCVHCETPFTGRYCPQCGLEFGASRFTLSTLMHKVLDVVGYDEYGNRSILRTLRDLFWRPGYMIRDYLGGHSVAYFQPFKLLLLLTVLFTLLLHLMGVEPDNGININKLLERLNGEKAGEALKPIFVMAVGVIQWFRENLIYSIILQNIFIVTAMWKVYRKRSPYSWTETFVAQMYICCQFMLLSIIQLLVTWHYESSGFFPYFVADELVLIFLLYDFFQLYGERRLWGVLWRLIKIIGWIVVQYILGVLLLVLALILYVIIWAAINGKLTDLS